MSTRSERHHHHRDAGLLTSPHYAELEQRLTHDPHVQSMARQLIADLGGAEEALDHLGVTPAGPVPWHFVRTAGAEYQRRGGTSAELHIGAVAEAVVRILRRALPGPAVVT